MDCLGNTADHCCWLAGVPCPFLREDPDGDRRWVCSLRAELGSWEAVHQDPRYRETVRPVWDLTDIEDCGDWPRPGRRCEECGLEG